MGGPLWHASVAGVALAYSMVGHGGASGYLGLGLLAGLPLAELRSQALLLNLLVSAIGGGAFLAAGSFRPRLLFSLLAGSVPAAFVGARLDPAGSAGKAVIGLALVAAAFRLAFSGWLKNRAARRAARPTPGFWALAGLGAGLGLLSGWSGVGGGIYLSPLLLVFGWASFRETACTSALFILFNSGAGAASLYFQHNLAGLPLSWAAAALTGALAGSLLGAFHLKIPVLQRVLAGVLGLAAFKLFS